MTDLLGLRSIQAVWILSLIQAGNASMPHASRIQDAPPGPEQRRAVISAQAALDPNHDGGEYMSTKRILTRMSAGVLAAAVCMVPAVATAAETPVRGGVAIVAIPSDAASMNPVLTTKSPDPFVGCMIYEGLIDQRMGGGADPLLAKSWTISPDGKTYTFDLVEAQWHDGKPFTSSDVKYTLLEVSSKYSSTFGRVGKIIEGIDDSDPRKAVITLSKSYGPFLYALGCQVGAAILPAHLFSGTDATNNPTTLSAPVGTGPFRLKEWVHGDHITVERNPNYRNPELPYLDGVVLKIVPSGSSRVLALRSGEVHYLPFNAIAFTDFKQVRENPELYLHGLLFPPPDDIMFFNTRKGPTGNTMVRHALAHATDRDFLVKAVWYGIGDPGISSFDTRIPWANNPKIDYRTLFPYDVDKANQLLDEAGFERGSDGVRFELDVIVSAENAAFVSTIQALSNMWSKVGIKVNAITLDSNALSQRVFKDMDYNVTLQGYTTYGDPALGIVRSFVSTTVGRPWGNPSGYGTPEMDALAQQGQDGTTQAERAVHYHRMQEIIARDLPSLVIHQRTTFDAANKRLRGVWEGDHVGYGDWGYAWLQPK